MSTFQKKTHKSLKLPGSLFCTTDAGLVYNRLISEAQIQKLKGQIKYLKSIIKSPKKIKWSQV